MNQFKYFKIIQISILAVLSLISIFVLFRPSVKQYVFSETPATVLFFLVWIILIAGFVFILIDFSLLGRFKTGDHALYGAAHSDQVSGIPNRFSCDTVIEKYYDTDLPDDLGCLMIDFSNLTEINREHGHSTGNQLLKEFSSILSSAALSLCFVGRNGGNKFLAIFEGCTKNDMLTFSKRVAERVEAHNSRENAIAIKFRMGASYSGDEDLNDITRLIALANSRIKTEK